MSVKTRIEKLERSTDSNRPRVAMVFLDCPDGAAVRVFASGGAEQPADTEWRCQVPAVKVFVGLNFDDI
jgi:hypothetical protein